ncbi:MAG: hypothetical protein ACFB4I_06585 [Cyanophyceae cyanobacterium]
MNDALDSKMTQLKQLCQQYKVIRMELFGLARYSHSQADDERSHRIGGQGGNTEGQ